MAKKPDFLTRLATAPKESEAAAAPVAPIAAAEAPAKRMPTRATAKHIGAYVQNDSPAHEQLALLKVRLKMDGAGVLEAALDALWRETEAKRTFGSK